jgi:hypothetical protein
MTAMRLGLLAAFLALLASSCSVDWSAPSTSDEATGHPGAGVNVYEFSNGEYFEAHPGGAVTIRPAHQDTIGITCDIGWGRSCAMGVGVPKGAACYCQSVWGPIWGHAS